MPSDLRPKIDVMGSATGELSTHSTAVAFTLGQAIAQAGCYISRASGWRAKLGVTD